MLHAPSAPGKSRKDYVWVDCFFYGFYMRKDALQSFSLNSTTVKPLKTTETPKTSFEIMKRSRTTRQHLDSYAADDEDGIPIYDILATIDCADPTKNYNEEDNKFSRKRGCEDDAADADASHVMEVHRAVYKGVLGVLNVMQTIKYELL